MGSKIQWLQGGNSWNPIRARDPQTGQLGWHCTHISEGCRNCYAEAMNKFRGTGREYKPSELKDGRIEIYMDDRMLSEPLSWRRPRLIFPCSMTDMFADFVTDAMLDKMFAIMALCPQHLFKILTKRSQRMRDYMLRLAANFEHRLASTVHGEFIGEVTWPLKNVWLGVSVENQDAACRLFDLREIPAALHWVSYEPAIGPVDFCEHLGIWWKQDQPAGAQPGDQVLGTGSWQIDRKPGVNYIRYGVIGGESGRGARDFDLNLAESFLRQFQAAGAYPYVKQLGGKPVRRNGTTIERLKLVDRKGGDIEEWPKILQVRTMPAWLS